MNATNFTGIRTPVSITPGCPTRPKEEENENKQKTKNVEDKRSYKDNELTTTRIKADERYCQQGLKISFAKYIIMNLVQTT